MTFNVDQLSVLWMAIQTAEDFETKQACQQALQYYALAMTPEILAHIAKLEAALQPQGDGLALRKEEAAHLQTIDERDIAQATADRLADLIVKITGVEIGEHSAGLGCAGNDPHLNAIDAAEGYLRKQDGLAELRALSEKATPGYWSTAPAIPGATQMFYLSGNHDANNREVDIGTIQGGAKSCEANARLIVACVNHVRRALAGDAP